MSNDFRGQFRKVGIPVTAPVSHSEDAEDRPLGMRIKPVIHRRSGRSRQGFINELLKLLRDLIPVFLMTGQYALEPLTQALELGRSFSKEIEMWWRRAFSISAAFARSVLLRETSAAKSGSKISMGGILGSMP